MKTSLIEIVNTEFVGQMMTNRTLKELQGLVEKETINISRESKKVLLLIDPQNDFISFNGSLPVKGAIQNTIDTIHNIYNNMDEYDDIYVTLDSHQRESIFFPSGWQANGQNVSEFTVIESMDGFTPMLPYPDSQEEYLDKLKNTDKKLTIWPYHCIIGTPGHAIENQLNQILQFYELYRDREVIKVLKGLNRYTEHYGAFKTEVDKTISGNFKLLLEDLKSYEQIDICGQARDYCVYETVKQMCEYYGDTDITKKINVLYNLSSSIGDNKECDKKYAELVDKYNIRIIYAMYDGDRIPLDKMVKESL